jgi:hypothetical protein
VPPRPLAGKGIFITHDPVGAGPRGEAEWDDLAACGVRWLALQVAWHRSAGVPLVRPELTRSPGRLAAETYAATRRGLQVWWWGWPVPSRVGDFLAVAEASQRAAAEAPLPGGSAAPAGWILNVETAEPGGRPAWAEGSEGAARDLVAGMRSLWPGPILATSHGRLARRQPWRAFGALDGVLPQAYDPDCSRGAGEDGSTFASRCADSYREIFGARQVALLLGANATAPACMAQVAGDAVAATDGALAWWSWTTLRSSEAKRAVVASVAL